MASHGTKPAKPGIGERTRSWWKSLDPGRQAAILVVTAVVACAGMIAINPFHAGTTDTGTQTSTHEQAPGTRTRKHGSPASASPSFDGTSQQIGQQVQDLLDSPSDGGVDNLSTLLYRYGDKDLSTASTVFDAIGAGETAPRVRVQAKTWWRQASSRAADMRLQDLTDSSPNLTRAAKAAARLDGGLPAECRDLADIAPQVSGLVAKGASSDYQTLTDMQTRAAKAVTACSANMDENTISQVFGQPQGETK